ncbi:hypothetical protein F0562_017869 [Nyssa sinensis]|uniref:Uncharacterized protein n=1 Tax=Nyssa sinensis TaxID=561372 RepID=A0A5J4ZJV8_9ASTE|nr:hypothetical protein F0562_017869 [Nyssa sinensis]
MGSMRYMGEVFDDCDAELMLDDWIGEGLMLQQGFCGVHLVLPFPIENRGGSGTGCAAALIAILPRLHLEACRCDCSGILGQEALATEIFKGNNRLRF